MSLLGPLQQRAARNGLNLFGLVDAQRFDGCQPCEQRSTSVLPGCGTILVLGTAGQSFWLEFQRQGRGLSERPTCEEVEELVASSVDAVADELEQAGLRWTKVDARWPRLNFGRLAEAAGFGIVSPVSGMLLNPTYGPWLRVRAALLIEGRPFGQVDDASITDRFKPCCTCDRPCVEACPPKVHVDLGRADRERCASHRDDGGCETGCGSRKACPIGTEHADGDGMPLHAHTIDRRTLQRWYGLGWWRFVPRAFRGGPRPR
ncbi:MAG: hypothetical protein ACE37K_09510 [Planctomycetota bacterium]